MNCTFKDIYDTAIELADEELDIASVVRNVNACLRFDLKLCMFLPTEVSLTRDNEGNFVLPENFNSSGFCKIKNLPRKRLTIFERFGENYFYDSSLEDTITVIYTRLPDVIPEDVKLEDEVDLDYDFIKIPALFSVFSFSMVEEEYGGDTERFPNEKAYYEELKSSFCTQMKIRRTTFLTALSNADYMSLERIMGVRFNGSEI